ncbi:thioredoxin domain-containing protein [Patescibacteria group bacterium]|nr:thioredoxin domain-containing protein [Patescibacteria group bacterium]
MSEEVEKTSPKKKSSAFEKMVPFLLVLSIGLAFLVGTLLQKVKSLEQGGTGPITTTGTTGTGDQGTGDQGAAPPPTAGGKLPEDQASKIPAVSAEDHVKGSRDAQVFLIEYSDLECPFCKRFHPTVQQAVDEYDGQVAWVYRHFPLDTLHSKADKEAEAVECAGELGGDDGFWALLDKIFEATPSNNGLNLDDLPGLAGEVGLNQSSFKDCLDSGRYAERVEADYQGGLASGVTGTPGSFVVNSKGEAWFIPGALPYDSLKVTIDEALGS